MTDGGEDQNRITAESLSMDTLSINAEQFDKIEIEYQGATYTVVKESGEIDLEVKDDD